MGTKNFFAPGIGGSGFRPNNINLEARAGNLGHYSGMEAGNAANKDIAAAQALYKSKSLKPSQKSVSADIKGPKV